MPNTSSSARPGEVEVPEVQHPMIWKSAVRGLAIYRVEMFDCYDPRASSHIYEYVESGINDLPWHFRSPLKVYSHFLGLACMVTTGHTLISLPRDSRQHFLRRARFLPLIGMVEKLIGAFALLCLFDHPDITLATRDSHIENPR